jgi:glucose/arabinose dehydrogenase
MRARSIKLTLATAAACCLLPAAGAAAASGPPPPPTSPSGKTVTLVAAGGGLNVPTSFAFGKGTVFEGDGGSESAKVPNGGVNVLKGGKASILAGSPAFVAGLTWHKGALYVSGGVPTSKTAATWTIQKWSGWNGTSFAKRTVLYTAPKGFQGFNGIAFGPDGRLYVGADVGLLNGNDHGPASRSPYLYDILSLNASGKGLKVFASGIRQPWQFVFPTGSKNPLVSDLGPDAGAKNPLDAVLKVSAGDNYGFPTCIHTTTTACGSFAKPFKTFAPHTDIMGLAIIGKTLYMTSFAGVGGKGPGGEVLSMPLAGGKVTPVLTGFVAPTVGLGANGNTLYVGELSAEVFSVKP